MLTIFLQWEKSEFNSKTIGVCRLHNVVAVCSWIASSTCLASFRFLLRIRFFYEKKNWVCIRIDWTTTCSEVCSRCKACKRAGNQCNQCRARRTWTVTMQPLLSGGNEHTKSVQALFGRSECKYMPAHVQEKMHTAPNHGESCKHFQAGIRHIRCIC